MVEARLTKMNIALGVDLIDPIAIQCLSIKHGKTKGVWAGSIKLHLLKPEIDGLMLLKGIRPFILTIDDACVVGKVCKTYHGIANGSNLSVKIKGDNLVGISAQTLFKEVLENSFHRGHEFKITGVQKVAGESHAFIIATTPQLVTKILLHNITMRNEVLQARQVLDIKGPRGIIKTKARKDALTLTLFPLPIRLDMASTSHEIYRIMGGVNIQSI